MYIPLSKQQNSFNEIRFNIIFVWSIEEESILYKRGKKFL